MCIIRLYIVWLASFFLIDLFLYKPSASCLCSLSFSYNIQLYVLPESDYLKDPRHENAFKHIAMPDVPANLDKCITTTVVSPFTHAQYQWH